MQIIIDIAIEMWATLCEMAPYILFGFLIAGILSILITAKTVEKQLGSKNFISIFKAAIFGVPLPLCSCSVIPVAVSLRKHGASKGAITSFLLSTPQTGIDSLIVTYSLLGPVFAIFRPVVALITGIIGGVSVSFFDHDENIKEEEKEACCSSEKGSKLKQIFSYGFIKLGKDIATPLIIGIFISGLIAALVPDNYFMENFDSVFVQMCVMMLIGIPMYVCSSASVPIAAALIAKGISPGAALIFLITGAATNAAGIATVYKIMGRKITIIYFLTVVFTAFISGFVLNLLGKYIDIKEWTMMEHSGMLASEIKILSAFILIGLFTYCILPFFNKKDACACKH